MASPFKFFRKHQASMMVVLVILAMLVFTLGDLFTANQTNFWLLGVLLGGAVFGVAGIGSGRWLQWGIGGAILGLLVGLVMPWFNKPDGVLATKFGIIEQEDLSDLSERRDVANGFITLATEEAFGPGTGRFARGFGFGQANKPKDLLFGRLMTEEAKTLGITVSDDMVRAYINQQTGDRLSREGFAKSRMALSYKNSQVLSEALFDILREQIRSKIAYFALTPDDGVAPPSPAVLWEYFNRFSVRQAIHVAEIEVDAFLGQVDDPSDAEIDELFASAAVRQPNQVEPGSPGFFLPGRARIAWLEQDYGSIESTVPPVADEDVETFYKENRDVRYRTIIIPEKPDADAEGISIDGATQNGEAPAGVTPGSEAAPAQDDESSDEPGDDSSATEDVSDQSAVDAAPPETTSEDQELEPAQNETAIEEGSENGGQFSIDDPEVAAVTETPEDTESPAESASTIEPTKSDEGADTTDAGAGENESLLPLLIPDASEPESADDNAAVEPEYEYRELNDELRESIREEILQQRVLAAIDKKMIDSREFLRSIQSELSNRRAEIMNQDPRKFLDDPKAAAIDLRRAMAALTPELRERMKNYARDNALIYADTPRLVSYREFSDKDDYPLGVAIEPNLSPFEARGAIDEVAYRMFSGFNLEVAANDAQLFMPERAVYRPIAEDGTESHYAYWTVEFLEPHVPTLDEPGVRDQVVLAFKRAKAREILAQRAEQLAQKVRDGLLKADEERMTMAATLETESITGKEGSATLSVRSSQPFSWLRQTQTPQTSFQSRGPQAELSTIRFADGVPPMTGVNNEFMKTVFEEFGDEEVGIVPNGDRTRYFLVHVTNRFPTEDKGIDGLRDQFARAGQMNFQQPPVMELISGAVVNPVVVEWQRAIWRKYDVDPDADPES